MYMLSLRYNAKGDDYMSLKNRSRMTSSIDNELLEKLKELSEESRIPISRLLDEAIKDLLKKHRGLSIPTLR